MSLVIKIIICFFIVFAVFFLYGMYQGYQARKKIDNAQKEYEKNIEQINKDLKDDLKNIFSSDATPSASN